MSTTLSISLNSEKILENLPRASIYKKLTFVYARNAKPGESIPLDDHKPGFSGQINFLIRQTADKGDYFLQTPDGEKFFRSFEFSMVFKETDEPGLFTYVTYARAIQNPCEEGSITGSQSGINWSLSSDCMILDNCNCEGKNMANDPYIMSKEEFEKEFLRIDVLSVQV
jgi:hypothetical protein